MNQKFNEIVLHMVRICRNDWAADDVCDTLPELYATVKELTVECKKVFGIIQYKIAECNKKPSIAEAVTDINRRNPGCIKYEHMMKVSGREHSPVVIDLDKLFVWYTATHPIEYAWLFDCYDENFDL